MARLRAWIARITQSTTNKTPALTSAIDHSVRKIQAHGHDPKAVHYKKQLRKYPVPIVLAHFIEKHYPD